MLHIVGGDDTTTSPPSDTPKKTRKSLGRRKIKMEKIENLMSRQVTFSKRRSGLFKKASELCVLTGSSIAIVVESPSKRVFAFGHPDADPVLDHYLAAGNNDEIAPKGFHDTASTSAGKSKNYDKKYDEVSRDLEMEKKRKETIEEAKRWSSSLDLTRNNNGGCWWEEDVESIEPEELEDYAMALDELLKKVSMKADDLKCVNNASSSGARGGLQGYSGNLAEDGGDGGGGLNLSYHHHQQSDVDAINYALATTTTSNINGVDFEGFVGTLPYDDDFGHGHV